jgi:hypothetical protein
MRAPLQILGPCTIASNGSQRNFHPQQECFFFVSFFSVAGKDQDSEEPLGNFKNCI